VWGNPDTKPVSGSVELQSQVALCLRTGLSRATIVASRGGLRRKARASLPCKSNACRLPESPQVQTCGRSFDALSQSEGRDGDSVLYELAFRLRTVATATNSTMTFALVDGN
jgi:hypothetical protein